MAEQSSLGPPNPRPGSYKGSTIPPRGPSSGNTRPATTGLRVTERRGKSHQHLYRNSAAPRERRTRSAKYLLQPLRSPYEAVRTSSEPTSYSSSTGKRRNNCLGGFVARGPNKDDVRSMLPWWPGTKQPGLRLTAGVDSTTADVKNPPGPDEIHADTPSAKDDDTFEQGGHGTSMASRGSFEAETCKEQLRLEDLHVLDRPKHTTTELSASEYNNSGCITRTSSDADFPTSGLFDSSTPPVPMVDQYINDDNLLYEAITKRGRTEALPVNNDGRGMLGLEKVVDGRSNDKGLLQDVEPEALLFSDEDIDKVPYGMSVLFAVGICGGPLRSIMAIVPTAVFSSTLRIR